MSYHSETKVEIETILNKAFAPLALTVIDESDSHKHHPEARMHESAGHFKVFMKSKSFDGLSELQRHRLVYATLKDLMDHKIHAISMKLLDSHDC